jgi:hypothetical protein
VKDIFLVTVLLLPRLECIGHGRRQDPADSGLMRTFLNTDGVYRVTLFGPTKHVR